MNYKEIIGKAKEFCEKLIYLPMLDEQVQQGLVRHANDLLQYLETLSPESLKEDKEAVADGYVSRTIEGFVVEYGPKLPEAQRDFAECPSDDSLRVFKDWMKAVNYHMLADQRQFPTNIRKCKVLIMETLPKPNAKDLEVKE